MLEGTVPLELHENSGKKESGEERVKKRKWSTATLILKWVMYIVPEGMNTLARSAQAALAKNE